MKTTRYLIAFLVCWLSALTSFAYDVKIDGIYYDYSTLTNEATVVSEGDLHYYGDIVIPSTIVVKGREYKVTRIGKQAFFKSTVTSVEMPNTITEIRDYAFSYCSGLTSITIPENVTLIYQYAFAMCNNLSRVNFPDKLKIIDVAAFGGTAISSVNLPKKLERIGAYAFTQCMNLKSITFPEDIQYIGDCVCANGALEYMSIPGWYYKNGSKLAPVSPVSDNVISETPTLKTLSIDGGFIYRINFNMPENVETLIINSDYSGTNAYLREYDYKNKLYDGVDSYPGIKHLKLGEDFRMTYGFNSCTFPNLKTLELPADHYYYKNVGNAIVDKSQNILLRAFVITDDISTVKRIGTAAFSDFADSTFSIDIPEGVEDIEDYGLYYGIKEKVTLPHSLRYIGKDWSGGQNSGTNSGWCRTLIAKCDLDEIFSLNKDLTMDASDLYVWNKDYYLVRFKNNYGNTHVLDKLLFTSSPTSVKCTSLSLDNVLGAKLWGIEGDKELYHLRPQSTIYVPCYYIDENNVKRHFSSMANTLALTLRTTQPRIARMQEAVLIAETNIEASETNVGFEVRRYTAPAELPSTKCAGVIVGNMLTAEVKNLAFDYYKCRAFYEAADGNMSYGDWVTFDPTSTMYCDPIIHTYESINVMGKNAEVKGFVIEGTETVVSCGVQLYENGKWVDCEQDEMVENTFKVTIRNLANGEYRVRAYAVLGTKRVYGEERTFTVTYYEPETDRDALILVLKDGSCDKFILTVRPCVSVSGNRIFISGNNLDTSYGIDDVDYFCFGSSMTGIREVKAEEFVFEQRGKDTYFISCDNTNAFSIHSLNGVKQSTDIIKVENGVEVSLASLPKGVYIISSKGKSLKINKR